MSVATLALVIGASALPQNLGLAPVSPAEAHRGNAAEVSLVMGGSEDKRHGDLALAGRVTPSVSLTAAVHATRATDETLPKAETVFAGSFKIMDRLVLGAGPTFGPNGERSTGYGALVKGERFEIGVARDEESFVHGRITVQRALVLQAAVARSGTSHVFTAWTHALTDRLDAVVGFGIQESNATVALGVSATL